MPKMVKHRRIATGHGRVEIATNHMPHDPARRQGVNFVQPEAGGSRAARRAAGERGPRRRCRGCDRSGGELTENGCPECGPDADIR
jgi:hypothetical protein